MFILLNETVFHPTKYAAFSITLVIQLFLPTVYKVTFSILNHNYFLNAYSHNSAGLIYYTAFFEVKKRSLDFLKQVQKRKENHILIVSSILGHIEKIPHGEIKGKALS